jgi:hypothetical protein
MQKRHFGEREEQVLVPMRRDHRLVQVGDSGLGTLGKGLEEALLEEHIACREARLTRRDGAPPVAAKDGLGVDPGRAQRPGARGQGQ